MRRSALFFLLSLTLLANCRTTPPEATSTGTQVEPPQVLISEILAGVEGNNNYEFIELYNTGAEPVDLTGWSLWYQLPTNQDVQQVFLWAEETLIPAKGHFLLVRTGEEVGVTADGVFTQSLNISGGSLWLVDSSNQLSDAISWGNAPGELGEGQPAPPLENGASLERLPGGQEGNGQDTQDNQIDFVVQPHPEPQNVASARPPGEEQPLVIEVILPEQVKPGANFALQLKIENLSDTTFEDVNVLVPLSENLDVSPLQADFELVDGTALWKIDSIEPGEDLLSRIELTAPWSYLTLRFSNIYAEIPATNTYVFTESSTVAVTGGTIPVAIARDLVGSEVIVEGVATMYTG